MNARIVFLPFRLSGPLVTCPAGLDGSPKVKSCTLVPRLRTMKRATTPRSIVVGETLILESVIVTLMSTMSVGSVVRGRAVPAAAAGTSDSTETATMTSERTLTLVLLLLDRPQVAGTQTVR